MQIRSVRDTLNDLTKEINNFLSPYILPIRVMATEKLKL